MVLAAAVRRDGLTATTVTVDEPRELPMPSATLMHWQRKHATFADTHQLLIKNVPALRVRLLGRVLICGRPTRCKRFLKSIGVQSDAAICPAFDAAMELRERKFLVAFRPAQSAESWRMSAPVQKITFAEMRARVPAAPL
jgi:hypothetical protein